MGECEEPPATVPDTCVCPAARQGDVRSMWPPVNSRLRAMRPWVADASTRSSSSKTVWTPTRRSSASATRANTISPPSRGTAISTSSPGSLSTSTRRLSTIVPPTSVAMPWATSPPCRVRESCSRGRAGRDCDDNGSDRNHGGRPANTQARSAELIGRRIAAVHPWPSHHRRWSRSPGSTNPSERSTSLGSAANRGMSPPHLRSDERRPEAAMPRGLAARWILRLGGERSYGRAMSAA